MCIGRDLDGEIRNLVWEYETEMYLGMWAYQLVQVIGIRKQKHELLEGLQQGAGKPGMGEKAVGLTYVEHERQS